MREDFSFADFPIEFESSSSHIKVVGVGGGGCNVVAEIYNAKIKDVDLVICNTDEQALNTNPINHKVKLGSQKLGAGLDPNKGRIAAQSSHKEIECLFDENTEMVFVTTCLGGGTGTGAAPVIAEIAKRLGKLVVAVVTLPFKDEGIEFTQRAKDGLKELKKNVDSTIIIDNQKIYEPYGNISMAEAYSKVNEILVTAVKGISEIVTVSGKINVDMNDVKKIMADSGTATIGIGSATIEEGVGVAVENALQSYLLSDCNFASSQGALVVLTCDDSKTPMSARRQVSETVQNFAGNPEKFKLGVYTGSQYGDTITVTVVITGFTLENLPDMAEDHIIFIDENGEVGGSAYTKKGNPPTHKTEIEGTEYVRRKMGDKPVLVVEEESELIQLEEEPAYKRKSRKKREKMNSFIGGEIGADNVFSTDNPYLHKTQD